MFDFLRSLAFHAVPRDARVNFLKRGDLVGVSLEYGIAVVRVHQVVDKNFVDVGFNPDGVYQEKNGELERIPAPPPIRIRHADVLHLMATRNKKMKMQGVDW